MVKKAITELVNDGTLEFTSFGGATFIKLGAERNRRGDNHARSWS